MRWVYATLNSDMSNLNPPNQHPSQDELKTLDEKDELETFQICGVLNNGCYFDFIYSKGLKTSSGCKGPMTEYLINPAGAHIRKIEIHYFFNGN